MVSIIITTYGTPDTLERAITSALNQTYKDIEIVVVDDNNENSICRKETEEIVEKFENKVKYIKHKVNQNGAAARNTGIQYSSGEYITFLDNDDILMPNRVKYSVEKLKSVDADALFTGVIITEGKYIRNVIEVKSTISVEDLLNNPMAIGSGSNIFITRKVIERVKGFDKRFNRHQDLEFMIRVLDKFNATTIKYPLVIKAQNAVNNNSNLYKYYESKKMFWLKFKNYISCLPNEYDFYQKQYYDLFRITKNKSERIFIRNEMKKNKIKNRKVFLLNILFSINCLKLLMKKYISIRLKHNDAIFRKSLREKCDDREWEIIEMVFS